MLAEIGKEKRIMLSGIKHDQTEAKFGGYTLQPAEGILIASDLRVSLVLSSLSLHLNGISNEGAKAIAEALSSSGRAVQTNLNLAGNPLGPSSGIGPEGARAIAEALRFKALLKELECARFSGTSNANRAARARARLRTPSHARSPFLRLPEIRSRTHATPHTRLQRSPQLEVRSSQRRKERRTPSRRQGHTHNRNVTRHSNETHYIGYISSPISISRPPVRALLVSMGAVLANVALMCMKYEGIDEQFADRLVVYSENLCNAHLILSRDECISSGARPRMPRLLVPLQNTAQRRQLKST
jgi:hypothetical protein